MQQQVCKIRSDYYKGGEPRHCKYDWNYPRCWMTEEPEWRCRHCGKKDPRNPNKRMDDE